MRNLVRHPMSLLQQRRGTIAGLQTHLEEAGSQRGYGADGGDPTADDVDRATTLSGRDADAILAAILSDNRLQVDHAMQRLEAGGYGVCEDCGAVIPVERLRVFPEATRCVGCQRQRDMVAHVHA